ncbi:MAG: AIR synthase-related protein, partial [Fimbriimonadaceae bacterium]
AKGNVGMDIDLDRVPMRESDMTAYELMLSESQERMLAVAIKGREGEVLAVFHKWGLQAEVIGWVNEEGETVVKRYGEVAAHLTARWLADMCPTYVPNFEVPAYFADAKAFDPPEFGVSSKELLLKLLSSPNVASKKWVTEQYDQTVQTQTTLKCGEGDAAVMAIRGSRKGIALKIDGNGRQIYFDPYVGGQLAVCEAARNVACTGAKPVAVTDGLNFGNPQRPHVYWQFKESVRGIAEACEILDTPVISGNVSFYNESDLGEVLPTPLIGMLGIIDDVSKRIGMAPGGSGSLALVSTPLGTIPQSGLGASETLAVLGIENGVPVPPNILAEKALCDLLVGAVAKGLISCAHDCSEGGLSVALAEMALGGNCGVRVQAENVFAELPGRVIVGNCGQNWQEFQLLCEESGLQFQELGTFNDAGARFEIVGELEIALEELKHAYEDAIPHLMSSNR